MSFIYQRQIFVLTPYEILMRTL